MKTRSPKSKASAASPKSKVLSLESKTSTQAKSPKSKVQGPKSPAGAPISDPARSNLNPGGIQPSTLDSRPSTQETGPKSKASAASPKSKVLSLVSKTSTQAKSPKSKVQGPKSPAGAPISDPARSNLKPDGIQPSTLDSRPSTQETGPKSRAAAASPKSKVLSLKSKASTPDAGHKTQDSRLATQTKSPKSQAAEQVVRSPESETASQLSTPQLSTLPPSTGLPQTLDARPQTPFSILLPYQREWVLDAARFKIGLWARQTGKSFSTAGEAVADCLQRKTTWVTLSAGERQALEWMRKAREWAEAFHLALGDYTETRDSAEAVLKTAELTWPNGSRLIALPANPDTARGYSANLTLDEFAFHERPDDIWRAIYPSISNPLKGVFKIRVVSTPNGTGNKFHDLWAKDNGWSKHKIDIETAVQRGLPLNLEALRQGLDDPDGWAQEYLCEFMDSAAVLLPYELIARCESADATLAIPPEYWTTPRPLFLGIDFARKHDLSVAWTCEQAGDLLISRECLELRDMSTPDQIEQLRPRLRAARRVCLDYTGSGVGLGDFLVQEFGEWNPAQHRFGKVELCTFTQPLKVEIFSKLRMAFESVKLRVPVSRAHREDLHSMQRVTTSAGTVTYRAPHTADGHADRCAALALALRAAGTSQGGGITDATLKAIAVGGARSGRQRTFTPRRLS